MHTPPCLLVVDDQPMNVDILCSRLAVQGYEILTAYSGEEALALATARHPDLLLLDVMLPTLDGLAVCRQLKAAPSLPFLPILMISAKTAPQDIIAGLEAGADDYLTKPVDHGVLVARVQALLRRKAQYDTTQAHATALATWSRTLEQRVQAQVTELERLGRLKQVVAPQLAELVVSGASALLGWRQHEDVTVVCCALDGFPAWAATAASTQVVAVLEDYHTVLGQLSVQWEGTVEQWLGSQVRVVFNAPLPCPDPAARAVRMAVALRDQLAPMRARWGPQASGVDLRVGMAQGAATLGMLQGAGRWAYTVLGPVAELAVALCDAAPRGQILLSPAVWTAVAGWVEAVPVTIPGLPNGTDPRAVMRLHGMRTTS